MTPFLFEGVQEARQVIEEDEEDGQRRPGRARPASARCAGTGRERSIRKAMMKMTRRLSTAIRVSS